MRMQILLILCIFFLAGCQLGPQQKQYPATGSPDACPIPLAASTTLTNDLTSSSTTCITFATSNIYLDCAGHSMTCTGSCDSAWGVYASSKSNNSVYNCTIINYGDGIYYTHSGNNSISNTFVSGATKGQGILFQYASSGDDNVTNATLSGNMYGVYNYQASNVSITNSTFSGTEQSDFFIDGSSQRNVLLNDTFRTNFINLSTCSPCNLTIKWYLRANVSNSASGAIQGAYVNVSDINGKAIMSNLQTDSNGLTATAILTDIYMSKSGTSYTNTAFNNHTITASYSTPSNTTSRNFTISTMYNVTLYATPSSVSLCNSTSCSALGTPYYGNPASWNASGICSGTPTPHYGNFSFYINGSLYSSYETYNWVDNQINYTNASLGGTVLKKSDTVNASLTCSDDQVIWNAGAGSSSYTVNNTAPSMTSPSIVSNESQYYNTSLLTCNNGTFSDPDSDAMNKTAYWNWWLNGTKLSVHTETFDAPSNKLNNSDVVNCSVIVNDTGYDMKSAPEAFSSSVTILGKTTPNLTVTLPPGISIVNFTCFQPFMNNTPPNGQTLHVPIFNITNNASQTYYNITIALNASLSQNFSIWGQTSYYRNPASVNISYAPSIIIKRLYAAQNIGIWLWGECDNVSDNQSNSIKFIWGGG